MSILRKWWVWLIAAIVAVVLIGQSWPYIYYSFFYRPPELFIPKDATDPVPNDSIVFCPVDEEGFARQELGLGDRLTISEDEFVSQIIEQGNPLLVFGQSLPSAFPDGVSIAAVESDEPNDGSPYSFTSHCPQVDNTRIVHLYRVSIIYEGNSHYFPHVSFDENGAIYHVESGSWGPQHWQPEQ